MLKAFGFYMNIRIAINFKIPFLFSENGLTSPAERRSDRLIQQSGFIVSVSRLSSNVI